MTRAAKKPTKRVSKPKVKIEERLQYDTSRGPDAVIFGFSVTDSKAKIAFNPTEKSDTNVTFRFTYVTLYQYDDSSDRLFWVRVSTAIDGTITDERVLYSHAKCDSTKGLKWPSSSHGKLDLFALILDNKELYRGLFDVSLKTSDVVAGETSHRLRQYLFDHGITDDDRININKPPFPRYFAGTKVRRANDSDRLNVVSNSLKATRLYSPKMYNYLYTKGNFKMGVLDIETLRFNSCDAVNPPEADLNGRGLVLPH